MTNCSPAHRIFSLFFTCAIVAVSCSCAWGAGQEEIARFRREYPPAAKTIEQRFDQVRGKARVRLEQASGEIRRIEDVTFATLGPLRKFESIHRNPEEGVILKTRVVCIGKDSGFTLNQPAGREDYVVESIDEGSDLGRSYTTHFGKLLEAPYSVTRTTFADLLEYPDSNVLSAKPVEREGRSLLEVVIQHGKPEQPLQTRVLFDPAAGWVARQYQVSMMGSPQPNMRVEIEYRDDGVIPPFPKSVMFESGQQRWNCQFEELRAEPSDPEEFTLAFYGLEPVVLPSTPREIHWTWVFVGLGVASIVAAELLRMKSNR